MRIVLRVIALLVAISVFNTVWFILWFAPRMGALMRSGTLSTMTLIGWAVTLTFGPFAAVELFRLRNRGRIAALILFLSILLYYIFGLISFHQHANIPAITAFIVVLIGLIAVLLLPAAERACLQ